MKAIRDLIYFDYDKAKSLHSQLSGGLLQEITRAIENENNINNELGFDIKIIKAKTGEGEKERIIKTERVELYHELLNEIESNLTSKNILKDLNSELTSFNEFLEKVPNYTYVKATGWTTFEDYGRFTNILDNMNEIQRLVYASSLESHPEVIVARKQIDEMRKSLKRGQNTKELAKLKVMEKNFDKLIQENSDASLLDETFVERVKTFIKTLNPNRLNFRLLPFDDFPEFQIISNLKNDFLVDGSFDNVIYNYGSRPNIKLTVFGIITSCPQIFDERVHPADEFKYQDETELSVEKVYDKVFRGVFNAIEGLEKFFNVYHPKISVSPIGIYREIIIEE
ncbi:hypothetical protein C3L50_10835 [Flavobacterium alvei]|uniref:Uncharacterized protein n=1 Tax=Flavobacterium alvei TaxID=2080416 RepID=A0A2S5ABM6_9FLAO|nr:hypothetical protein [Flavobacterium alvei]POY39647.1 hypothetical protein C3L50_10835 [Flavobacterium alvei]